MLTLTAISSQTLASFCSAFPPALAEQTDKSGAVGIAIKIQTRIRDVLMKSFNIMADPATFAAEYLWSVCNSVTVLKGAIQAAPDSMQAVIHSLLKAMNRLAKDHNAQPHGALLSNKGIPKEAPTDAEYSSGAWFMYHALQGNCCLATCKSDH